MLEVMHEVSRVEIADLVEDVFDGSPVGVETLLDCAGDHGARSEVITLLQGLKHPPYRGLTELWGELRELPIERP